MAILLTGYIQVPSGISSYHWQVIVDLAWFSTLSHLATLTALRGYFRKRTRMAICRTGFMGVVLALLATALGPTGYISQFATSAVPAKCLYSPSAYTDITKAVGYQLSPDALQAYNKPLIILSLAFLVSSYVTRVIGIFDTASTRAQNWLRFFPGRQFREFYAPFTKDSGLISHVLRGSLTITYVLLRACYDIHGSMVWEVSIEIYQKTLLSSHAKTRSSQIFWLNGGLAWGTLRLVALRTQSKSLGVGEGVWGFGQTLPIVLSVLPLWSIYSSVCGEVAPSPFPNVYLMLVELDYSHPNPTTEQPCLPRHEERPGQADVLNELCRSPWFNRLIALMFGFAMVILADILYTFPSSPIHNEFWDMDILEYRLVLTFVLSEYMIRIGFCTSILIIFAALCLGFTTGRIVVPNKLTQWLTRLDYLDERECHVLREVFWALILVWLIALVAIFDWFEFLKVDAAYGRSLGLFLGIGEGPRRHPRLVPSS